MAAEDFLDKLKHEVKVIFGEEGKDKTFCSEQDYLEETTAWEAFAGGKERLFNVNSWSEFSGINSTFTLYNQSATQTNQKPEVGFFIKIVLPGLPIENWVELADIQETELSAQFTVHPCPNPTNASNETQHFFVKEASSTFRIEREGTLLRGLQIGKNEKINNHNYQAGDRAIMNTLIAEGGWAGFQDIQWGKLTDYLVGKKV